MKMKQIVFNVVTIFFLIVNVVWGMFVIINCVDDWVKDWHMAYYQRHNYPTVVHMDTVKPVFGHYT